MIPLPNMNVSTMKNIHDMNEDELFNHWNEKYGGNYKDSDARDHAFVEWCENNNLDFSL